MDDDDEFDFSDDGLDDLPANALQEFETTAFRATQHRSHSLLLEDHGHHDGGLVNLDNAADAPHFGHARNEPAPMDIDDVEPPPQSQVDVSKLLLRIKKVRWLCAPPEPMLTRPARTRQKTPEYRPAYRCSRGEQEIGRGRQPEAACGDGGQDSRATHRRPAATVQRGQRSAHR